MTYEQALKELSKGKKVKGINWTGKESYICLNDQCDLVHHLNGAEYPFSRFKKAEVYSKETWELYKDKDKDKEKETPKPLGRKACITFIQKLANDYAELRTDVSDMCNEFLSGVPLNELRKPEKRLINAVIPVRVMDETVNINVGYDTLTTEITYEDGGNWETAEHHEYYD